MSEHWLRRFQFYCAASEGSFHFLHAKKYEYMYGYVHEHYVV